MTQVSKPAVARAAAGAALAGLAFGVAGKVADDHGPDLARVLLSTPAATVLLAWAVGAWSTLHTRSRAAAAAAGVLATWISVASYYAYDGINRGLIVAGQIRLAEPWMLLAIPVGVLAGAAGGSASSQTRGPWTVLGTYFAVAVCATSALFSVAVGAGPRRYDDFALLAVALLLSLVVARNTTGPHRHHPSESTS